MNAQEFIKQYKEKELIHSINFEGDLMASERQIEQMLEEYAKTKALHIADVSNRRELLIAFRNWWYGNRHSINAITNDEIDDFIGNL